MKVTAAGWSAGKDAVNEKRRSEWQRRTGMQGEGEAPAGDARRRIWVRGGLERGACSRIVGGGGGGGGGPRL